MKTFSRFKVHLNNGTSYIDGTYGVPYTVEHFYMERWQHRLNYAVIGQSKLYPAHAVTMIEGLEDEK